MKEVAQSKFEGEKTRIRKKIVKEPKEQCRAIQNRVWGGPVEKKPSEKPKKNRKGIDKVKSEPLHE